jgi:hypothetical protein
MVHPTAFHVVAIDFDFDAHINKVNVRSSVLIGEIYYAPPKYKGKYKSSKLSN